MTNLIVAACLVLEAGGEGVNGDGMRAVHEVIHNRSVARHITEERVCLQPWQFSAFNGITASQAIAKASKHPQWQFALSLSAEPPKTCLTHHAQFYCTTNIFPKWAVGSPVAVIKRHKFFK